MFTWSLVGSCRDDITIGKKINNDEKFVERKKTRGDEETQKKTDVFFEVSQSHRLREAFLFSHYR